MMDKYKTFAEATSVLTNNHRFCLIEAKIDARHFGNIVVKLTSNSEEHIVIRFVKDRGTFGCDIGQEGAMHFIEDVCSFLGLEYFPAIGDFEHSVRIVSEFINVNLEKILIAFSNRNAQNTHEAINYVASRRSRDYWQSKGFFT
jgi:hypothetical protein